MKSGVLVDSLEHVPVRKDIEVTHKDGVMCVCPNVPGMRRRYLGEEVIGVANQNRGSIRRHLRVKQGLRKL